jgi:hypothetical protein
MAEKSVDGNSGGMGEKDIGEDNGGTGREEITEVRLQLGREMTLEEERRFLAKLFSESIGHDGWHIPHGDGETKGGKGNG